VPEPRTPVLARVVLRSSEESSEGDAALGVGSSDGSSAVPDGVEPSRTVDEGPPTPGAAASVLESASSPRMKVMTVADAIVVITAAATTRAVLDV
jgi:hypothetical protein